MAVYRPNKYCPLCGQLIKKIHKQQPPGPNKFVGDTFIGYEHHVCPRENEIKKEPKK